MYPRQKATCSACSVLHAWKWPFNLGWKDLLREGVWGNAVNDTSFPVWPLRRNIFRSSMSAELLGEATLIVSSLCGVHINISRTDDDIINIHWKNICKQKINQLHEEITQEKS